MLDYNPPPPDFDEYKSAQVIVSAPSVPQSREAEEAVIGSVLINPMMYWEISKHLKTNDFYIKRNGFIWDAFSSLSVDGTPIDLLTVCDALKVAGVLEEIGGMLGVTRERVRQLRDRALKRLRDGDVGKALASFAA